MKRSVAKTLLVLAFGLNVFVLLFALQNRANRLPESLLHFGKQFNRAHQSFEQQPEQFWTLFHWEGTDPDWKFDVHRANYWVSDLEISNISFRVWDEARDLHDFFPGEYVPNLTPEWILQVEFEADSYQVIAYPIGKHQTTWKIIQPFLKS